MKMSKKALALMLSMMLVFGCAVGGTVAWLTAKTDAVTNTFTVGNINIELKEHKLNDDGTLDASSEVVKNDNYKMVPGDKLPKDPFVTVKADSEKCYVFIKVIEENNTFGTDKKAINYAIDVTDDANGYWVAYPGDGDSNVYYRVVNGAAGDQKFDILDSGKLTIDSTDYEWTKNQVLVNPEVTKDYANKPMLTFKAAAVQYDNIGDVTAAWAQVSTLLD